MDRVDVAAVEQREGLRSALPVLRHQLVVGAAVIGRREPVIVREAAWLSDFVAGDPFAGFPLDRWELAVAFLPLRAAPLDPGAVHRIDGLEAGAVRPHELRMAGRRDVRRPGATYGQR